MSNWYTIKKPAAAAVQAAAEGAVVAATEILIYKEIGDNWWSDDPITAARFREDLAALQVPKITVRILSAGGSVADGLGIYNALKNHPAEITTINDGLAASVASAIFMAGDIRIVASNSLLMIHAPWTYVDGNAADLREMADKLDVWASALAVCYAEATGKTKDEVMALIADGKDHFFTADEALAEGYATQIGEAAPMPAAQLHGLLGRFNAPRNTETPAAAAATTTEITMTTTVTNPAAQTPSAADIEAAKQQAIKAALVADQQRREGIAQAAAKHMDVQGMADTVKSLQDDPSISVEAAGLRILAKLAENATPVAGVHNVRTVEDETDKRRGAVVNALLVRAGVASAEVKATMSANPFRGSSLMDLARASLDRLGYDYRGRDKMEIVAAAFTQSASDFPILLENAMHKSLQAGYAVASDTWRRFCAVGSVSDFKDHPRYRTATIGNLQPVNELGEFRNVTIPDGEKSRVRVGTKGMIVNVSRQVIVNDDLGAFVGMSNSLGRSAARSVESDVYALLALNGGLGPTMDDGFSLFHANHANIGTGAAISALAIDADRVVMASQKCVGGDDYLDLRPAVLLLPLGLGATARVINNSAYDPDTANKLQRANPVGGLFRDIVDTARLSGTRRYLFADPMEAPVIEVDFLDGNEQPVLENQTGFEVDGFSSKVRSDYGVSAVDYRGAVTNAGA